MITRCIAVIAVKSMDLFFVSQSTKKYGWRHTSKPNQLKRGKNIQGFLTFPNFTIQTRTFPQGFSIAKFSRYWMWKNWETFNHTWISGFATRLKSPKQNLCQWLYQLAILLTPGTVALISSTFNSIDAKRLPEALNYFRQGLRDKVLLDSKWWYNAKKRMTFSRYQRLRWFAKSILQAGYSNC